MNPIDAIMAKIDVSTFPMRLTVDPSYIIGDPTGTPVLYSFTIHAHDLKDRTDPTKLLAIAFTFQLSVYHDEYGYSSTTEENLMRCIRHCFRRVVLHELDECLHVNGKPMLDPHTIAEDPKQLEDLGFDPCDRL